MRPALTRWIAPMRRREFITLAGGMAVWPLAARAQQPMPVIGYAAGSVKLATVFLDGVRKGLAEFGYVDGQNFRFELRDGNFQNDLLPIQFRKLVDENVTL